VEAEAGRTERAVALLGSQGRAFRRTARRFSLCADDADDALQRASLILLTKAPPHPQPRLTAWMHLVTRREALAVRRDRERAILSEAVDTGPADAPCPAERTVRQEQARHRAAALARLKPHERRALVLKGMGYSYAEICELTGWTYTKTNRCLAEGRERLRKLGALD
jgi:RNA polymerase sigma factor (sigma-70 family)